jgi:hypothetical protein
MEIKVTAGVSKRPTGFSGLDSGSIRVDTASIFVVSRCVHCGAGVVRSDVNAWPLPPAGAGVWQRVFSP